MQNADHDWQYAQQRFQNATDGISLKERLLECLTNLYFSHDQNVTKRRTYYEGIVNWQPTTPSGAPNPPPDGWYLDPEDLTWKRTVEPETEGENDG